MKTLVTLCIIILALGCNSQEKGEKTEKEAQKEKTGSQPKEHAEVHKEYDEFGNLIRFDSIYTWSYSTTDGDSIRVNLDSIMKAFKKQFEESPAFDWSDDFFYFPKPDSLFMKGFFREDYFFDHWQKEKFDLEKIMRKMDSSRNAFIQKFHPGLMPFSKDSVKN